ncbi:transmembrane protein 104-like isoform X2 [Liolophura sinensis]|uniref:transmembrane protein 104-like isoform X2 n=1 Tax=Liolophura sinensis TaxID=3198878 RepID=UPI00315964FD
MAGGITDTGAQFSPAIGMIYIFNLIVGTGALTMPGAFHSAGWLFSLITIIILGFMSYLTATFVIESMAAANVKLKLNRTQDSSPDCEERKALISDQHSISSTTLMYDDATCVPTDNLSAITERVEMGQMASMFFNKVGVNCFYLCLVIYLYGDLAIYAAAVPKSVRLVMCTYQLPNGTACNVTVGDEDQCWPGVPSVSRMDAYRIAVGAFGLLLGPFVFFNVQKTKYLQLTTTFIRWLAFSMMIVLAVIRLANGQGEGHPKVVDISGVPNLFGVCVYSFMCHHSLPSLVAPIKKKAKIYKLLFGDYSLISVFYLLLSFTAIYSFNSLKDLYTLNFLPDRCDTEDTSITNIKFIQYFIVLFPVFALSTNFPIIGITLRNNLKTLFYKRHRPYPWIVDRIVFPLVTILPPFAVAFGTNQVDLLVGITGSYAGAGIQYIIPAMLVLFSRRNIVETVGRETRNVHRSPFRHIVWIIFVMIWAVLCIVFVTVNHIINGIQ